MAVPADVVVQPDLQFVQRQEALLVDGLGLQRLVRRHTGRVVVRAALPQEGPFVSGCPQGPSMAALSGSLPLSAWNAWMSARGRQARRSASARRGSRTAPISDNARRWRLSRLLPCRCRRRLSQDVGYHPKAPVLASGLDDALLPGVRLSAARLEPVVLMALIQRHRVDRPGPCSAMISWGGLPPL